MTEDPAPPLETIAVSLRRERERAGLSLSELAKRAGIAKSTLSQLESASGNPSIETLWALGVALGIPFSRLVDPPKPRIDVIRSGQAPTVRSQQSPYSVALLSSCPSGAQRDLHLIEVEPGEPRRADAHIPGTVEHLIITAGQLRAGPEGSALLLDPGDYASFSGDVPHLYEALKAGTTAVMVLEYV